MTRQQQPLVPLREDDDGFCAVYWSRVFDYAGHNPVRVNPSYAFTVLDGKLQRYATVSLDVELSEGGRKKWKRLSSIAAADTYEQLFTMLGTELDAAAAVRNALDTNA